MAKNSKQRMQQKQRQQEREEQENLSNVVSVVKKIVEEEEEELPVTQKSTKNHHSQHFDDSEEEEQQLSDSDETSPEESDEETNAHSDNDDDNNFEFMDASDIKKGTIIILQGNRVCKVVEKSTSKTGKHGGCKCHIISVDLFNGKKVEEIISTQDKARVPIILRNEYRVISVNEEKEQVELVQFIKNPKINSSKLHSSLTSSVPTNLVAKLPLNTDSQVAERIVKLAKQARSLEEKPIVMVLSTLGKSVIVACRSA